jgi:muramoyltetrapeptide carboxypeptidase
VGDRDAASRFTTDDDRRVVPPALRHGGTIAIVSPASPVLEFAPVANRKALVREFGLHRPLDAQLQPRSGVCGRSSEGAAADIEAAFADPTVDAIVCLGGGHASAQLLRLLVIAGNPKPFVGFSDITALHAALGKRAALVTFWGPMFGQLGSASAATRACLLHTLMGEPQTRPVARAGDVARTLVRGTAEGELVGATLSLLSSLLGAPWAVAARGRVLLLEDVGEEPRRIDRYLTHLWNAGIFDECAGICIGEFVDCEPRSHRSQWSGPTPTVEDVVERFVRATSRSSRVSRSGTVRISRPSRSARAFGSMLTLPARRARASSGCANHFLARLVSVRANRHARLGSASVRRAL